LILKLSDHIKENFPNIQGKKILIACSGGLDSMSLWHAFKELNFDIGIAHCNFSLRGNESDEDQKLVAEKSQKDNTPFFTETFKTKEYAKEHKLSTQVAARQLRYLWFEEIATNNNYDLIATAHHGDDDLETFFINLSRGTGLRGLTGIPSVNKNIIRPLLPFSRKEILQYAQRQGIYWREDSSNIKEEYLRNKIRLQLTPVFKGLNKNPLQTFQKTQQNLKDTQALIEDYLAIVYQLIITKNQDGYAIDIAKLKELPNTSVLLFELLSPFGFSDFKAINELTEAQSGKQLFSETHRLLKDRDCLFLSEKKEKPTNSEFFIKKNQDVVSSPIKLSFTPSTKVGYMDATAIFVDANKLEYPLTIRKWREGDVFKPFGMVGKKKVSKFFKDEKLSLAEKERVWILESDNKIVWIIGLRADNRFKVTETTQHILKIKRTA
jgi:tRNA(Ile)-lysidine synthase